MPHDVFIGYSQLDSEAAEVIQTCLNDVGISCFRDTTGIVGSEEWIKVVTAAIRECHVFLAIVSRNSRASVYVGKELAFATHYKKPFVPVVLARGVELPDEIRFHLGGIQHILADPSLSAVLLQLADATARAVDREKHKRAWADRADVLARANYKAEVDFAVNGYGLTTFAGSNGTGTIERSAYVLSSEPNEYLGVHIQNLPVTSEFVVEVGIRQSAGDPTEWFGVEFGQEYPGDYYQFLLNGNGGVNVSKHFDRVWSQLTHCASLLHVKSKETQNQLTLARRESAVHLFVSGRHAVSIEDFDIRAGRPGLMVSRGIRVEFSDLQIAGVSLESMFSDALNHWRGLETKKAKQILEYVAGYDPAFHVEGWPLDAGCMLRQVRPDRNETVLIAVGSGMLPQLNDRKAAERLRDAIDRKSQALQFRRAAIVTDTGLLQDAIYCHCPIISIGGATVNQFTERIRESLQEYPQSSSSVHIQHSTKSGDRHTALWGTGPDETAAAVEIFVTSELLDKFLASIWKS